MLLEPVQLASNAGTASLTIEPVRAKREAHVDGFDATLVLASSRWRDADQYPSSVRVENIWLASKELRALLDHTARWLALPLAELEPRRLDGAFDLAGLPGDQLLITFGEREDTVASKNPVVTIAFAAGSLRGEFHFVTDQSCLGQFAYSLERLVLTAMA
jgi:hypothetical protein